MSLSIEEQEVHINFMRDEDKAQIYASDITFITKLEKLVKKNPIDFKRIAKTDFGCTYEFPKRFVSIRSKDIVREYTEEQKEAMKEQLMQNRKN